MRITAQIQDLWQAKKSQLSQAQRNFFQPFIDAAAPLGPEWLRSTTGPDGQPTMALFEDDDVEPEP